MFMGVLRGQGGVKSPWNNLDFEILDFPITFVEKMLILSFEWVK